MTEFSERREASESFFRRVLDSVQQIPALYADQMHASSVFQFYLGPGGDFSGSLFAIFPSLASSFNRGASDLGMGLLP